MSDDTKMREEFEKWLNEPGNDTWDRGALDLAWRAWQFRAGAQSHDWRIKELEQNYKDMRKLALGYDEANDELRRELAEAREALKEALHYIPNNHPLRSVRLK